MTHDPEELSAAFEDAAELCGAIALDCDFETDEYAFIWCGPGIVVGFEIEPGMTPEDVFVETLIMIGLSDDPELNAASEDPPDHPSWDFPSVGHLTPAMRARTETWVDEERSLIAANPQRFSH
jgi:hypothetical protein